MNVLRVIALKGIRWFKDIAVKGAAVVLVSLVMTEVCLRMFCPLYFTGYIGAYQYDSELGVRAKDSLSHVVDTDHRQEFITNALGTVNYETSFEHYDDLIFAIGDSYTQGTGNSLDTSYPFQLSMLLNTDQHGRFTPRVGLVNLGLAAYGIKQESLLLQRYAKKLGNPSAILQLGCENDLLGNHRFESGHRHWVDGNPNCGPFAGLLGWVTNEFEVLKRLKLTHRRLLSLDKLTKPASSHRAVSVVKTMGSGARAWIC